MSLPSSSEPAPSAARPQRARPQRAGGKLLLLVVLAVLCVFVAGIGFELSRMGGPRATAERFAYRPATAQGGPLPELWRVPEFAFPDQHRVALRPAELAGQVWIADFIFTTCTSVCPLLTAKLVMLQRQLAEPGLRFVSFSVDPEHDAPDVLARYAQSWNPGESRWRLLSTDAPGLARLADGMHVAVEPTGDPANAILHSSLFFLVDQRGNVRGIYDSNDDAALQRLLRDARSLLGVSTNAASGLDGNGQQLFAALGCDACHANPQLAPSLSGLAGREVQLASGERVSADARYLRDALLAPGQQLVAGYLNIMPSYSEVLSAPQVESLVSYVSGLSATVAVAQPTSPQAVAAQPVTQLPAAPPQPPTPRRTAVKATPAAAEPPPPVIPATSTDPVCHMRVRVTAGTPQAEHAGHSDYFCSDKCQAAFVATPEKYPH